MRLPLAYYGDPILRKKAAPVTKIDDEIRQLVQDMKETMDAEDGCGIAAPQVHRSIQLFITSIAHYDEKDRLIPGELKVYINPKIISHSLEESEDDEGCLSIPHYRGIVSRPDHVVIRATDLDGNIFEEEFFDYDAHIILHENDHLNGVLFIDRLPAKEKKEIEPLLRKIKKKFG